MLRRLELEEVPWWEARAHKQEVFSSLELELVGGHTLGVRAQLAWERAHLYVGAFVLEGLFTWRGCLGEGTPLCKRACKFTTSRQRLQGGHYTSFSQTKHIEGRSQG